uniref:Uncharacterized protein n=1 Tax=Pristionchus pacificus TaxID=54126 RepID=A0A454XZY7_PRIPA|eukprot:PDM61165.1 hypothetical protein PRIPAC_50607 [Pristionchus pacificus]
MDGSNAWDLIHQDEGPSGSGADRRVSRSPSYASKISDAIFTLDDIDVDTLNAIKAEEAAMDRKKRS